MSAPRATIAIPVYNSASTLGRCLESVRAQSLRDIEILVADDGSTDDSFAIAEAIAAQDPRIRVLRMPQNGGKPRAMNRMVEAASGAWVAVLDADDAYHPERLERLVQAGEAHGVEIVADNLFYVDSGIGRVLRTGFPTSIGAQTIDVAELVRLVRANSGGASFDIGILKPVIRRDFLQANDLTYHDQAKLSEDFYYLLCCLVAGGRARVLAEPYYYWTLPFGTISRRWTTTGDGAWRYDYRSALRTNDHYIGVMRARGQVEIVEILEKRARQYTAMVHYLDAQKLAANRRWLGALTTIVGHPSTYGLLAGRVAGRLARALRHETAAADLGPAP